jgi:hypothetical protein
MHIVINRAKHGKKIYNSTLLRESYRENGKVKKRTIANLSACSPEEIEAIRLALENKNNLGNLVNVRKDIVLEEGLSIGAAWVICQVAKILGIEKALGSDLPGKLALWQVIARVLDQGSRLSAVRLARVHDVGNVLGIERGFCEDDLYDNLAWLSDHQEEIEDRLFTFRDLRGKRQIYLYDVTSSYLEGDCNFFGAYGYNRDKKKGKKQIVIGLLCDELGDPLSVEVFSGDTRDIATFASQVKKVAERFGCERATLVGDRGMIKSAQIDSLPEGFYYITAITKPQIDSLLRQGIIQMELFDSELCEVDAGAIRYILKRNPYRAQELSRNREDKRCSVAKTLLSRNEYLAGHPRAHVSVAIKKVSNKIKQLKVDGWLTVTANDRCLSLCLAEDALQEKTRLDGCYVIKTDLPKEAAGMETVHNRYKDLASVEHGFRTCKTDFLEVRPVFVRNEKSSRGHVFTVMLAYMIVRYLQRAWQHLDITPEEGIKQLATLSSVKVSVKGKGNCLKIPRPREQSRNLIAALNITMPVVLPDRKVNVDTKKKLTCRKLKY